MALPSPPGQLGAAVQAHMEQAGCDGSKKTQTSLAGGEGVAAAKQRRRAHQLLFGVRCHLGSTHLDQPGLAWMSMFCSGYHVLFLTYLVKF